VFFSTIIGNLKSFLFAIVGAEYVLGTCCPGARTSTRS
jgi:2-polyprenyl-3-methyl-5-hydroxy-6-metoxy-1,4-benzoquinol methylase